MRFTLENVTIIILLNILLCILIWIKILNTDSLISPTIAFKPNFIDFERPAYKNFSTPKSKCIAHQNYYTPEEIINIFNFKDYKPCKTVGKDTITYINGNFKVKCSGDQKPLYGIDSNKIEIYGGSVKNHPKWSNTFPAIASKQFLFVKCSKSAQYAFVFNHFKQKSANKAKEIQNNLGGNNEPMSVLLLVFDSISKFSFERNLPLTKHFLQTLDTNKKFDQYFSVYQFNKSAIPQVATAPNMAQILYGKSFEEITKVVGEGTRLLEKNKEIYKNYQSNSIWRHFSSLGYVTMFSHSAVYDWISAFSGRYIRADHVFTNFWRHLWGVTGINPFMNGQKCYGGKNIHEYLLNYTYQFFENYPNNNKFAYVHSDAAHENTGNVKTIDEDLLRFLKSYLKLTKARNENLAIFLLSDHGNKRLTGSTQWDIRTYFEFHTPFTYLISTKKLIKSLNVHENLKNNEDQLISRYDINLSLKHLAYFPYNISLNSWYPEAKKYYTYNSTVSLFEEKVSFDRTCADIGVAKVHCLCSWYEPVENNNFEQKVKKEMIKLITKHYSFTKEQNQRCFGQSKVVITNFIKSKKIGKLVKLYKFEITTDKNSKIVVDYNFCLKENLVKEEDSFQIYENPYSYFMIMEEYYFLQLSGVSLPPECYNDFCDC